VDETQRSLVRESLAEAKNALMLALREAEDLKAPRSFLTKLERLCGQAEALQHSASRL
jgi:hypothetical protein